MSLELHLRFNVSMSASVTLGVDVHDCLTKSEIKTEIAKRLQRLILDEGHPGFEDLIDSFELVEIRDEDDNAIVDTGK